MEGAPVAAVAQVSASDHAAVAEVLCVVVETAAVAAVAPAAQIRVVDGPERAAVAPVAPIRGTKHAPVAQVFVGFFPDAILDAQVLRGKLPVGPQDGPVVREI